MTKVLQVNFTKGWGGGEEYICALINSLTEKKQTVDLLIQASSEAESKFNAKLNASVKIIGSANKLKNIPALIKVFQQYDVIHFHREHDLWMLPFVKLFCTSPKIIFAKHIPSVRFHLGNLLCDTITANSLFVEKSLRKFYPKANIKLIYPSIQIPSFDRTDELKPLEGSPSLLMGANFYKNQDEMLEIFAKLLTKLPNAHLYLSSGSTSETDDQTLNLKKIIAELKLTNKVHLQCCVARDEYLKLIRRADLFVYPFEKEPFGYVLLEAAVMDSLIVAYKGGGGEEILSKHTNTQLVSERNHEAFIQAIIEQSEKLPRKKTFNQQFYDQFSLEHFIEEHLELYGIREEQSVIRQKFDFIKHK